MDESVSLAHGGGLGPDRFDVSVIAPCFNEEGNIPHLVSRLIAVFDRRHIAGQIVLVNDASTDGTGPLIDEMARRHPEVTAVHHARNRGLSAGWDSGLAAASGTYVCFIDADLQNPPEEVWRLYREITQSRADVVQGVRSAIGRLKDGRYITSRVLNVMLNTVFSMSATDNKSGFVMALRETMTDVLRRRFRYRYSHVFVAVAAHARGYTFREVETLFQSRHAGNSFIKRWPIKLIVDVCVDIAKAVVEFRLSPQRIGALDPFLNLPKHADARRREGLGRRLARNAYLAAQVVRGPLVTRRVRRMYHALLNTQWLEPQAIRQLQEQRLRRLVRHVYHHVPYYRELMEQRKIRSEQIQTLDDLAKLPLLSGRDVEDNLYFDLFADNHRKREMQKVEAFAESGTAFDIYVDRMQIEMRLAAALRAAGWAAWRRDDLRRVLSWRSPDAAGWAEPFLETFDGWLLPWLGRRGAPSGKAPGWYRTPALGVVAFECDHHSAFHVTSESYIVEVVKDGRPALPGEEGEIVVTDLNSFSVPLIRYRTGDRAVPMESAVCACGRWLPRLSPVQGRASRSDGAPESTLVRSSEVA